jgi:3-oxoadipate enol-lactonase/4-carboxymuconolactone decarboxylase
MSASDSPLVGIGLRSLEAAPGRPLLVLGPSLGLSVASLWVRCVPELSERFELVGWDLPGHGSGPPVASGFGFEDLVASVAATITPLLRDEVPVYYLGCSVGGAVGLRLMQSAQLPLAGVAAVSVGPDFGDPDGWRLRADTVRAEGLDTIADGAPGRWFGAEFLAAEPERVQRLSAELRGLDAASYAGVCEAIARYRLGHQPWRRTGPVLSVWGERDPGSPSSGGPGLGGHVGSLPEVIVPGAGHLAPLERPDDVVAAVLATFGQAS